MSYLAYMRVNRPGWSRMHWRNRGWDASVDHFGAKHEAFDLPIPLLYTCASGRDRPMFPDDGSTLMNPIGKFEKASRPTTYAWRDHWIVASASSYAFNNHSAGTVSCWYCAPVRPFPRQIGDKGNSSRRMDISILRAPFPITEGTGLTSFSTCSLGHTDDPPFMPPLQRQSVAGDGAVDELVPHEAGLDRMERVSARVGELPVLETTAGCER